MLNDSLVVLFSEQTSWVHCVRADSSDHGNDALVSRCAIVDKVVVVLKVCACMEEHLLPVSVIIVQFVIHNCSSEEDLGI